MSYLEKMLTQIIVLLVISFIFMIAVMNDIKNDSHRELGSKGHVCFPNRTCREDLKCIYFDGMDHPVCVTR